MIINTIFVRNQDKIKTLWADIDADTIALQAASEEDEELGGVVEDNLARKRHISDEPDLVDWATESVGSFLGQCGVDRALTI